MTGSGGANVINALTESWVAPCQAA